jgi:hypothetical protein
MLAARSLLMLVGTLAVLATLWLTLLSGGGKAPTVTPNAAPAQPGATSYDSAIGAAQGTVQQSYEDAQRGSATAAP